MQRRGVVGGAIAFHTQAVHVHPVLAVWQAANGARQSLWQGRELFRVIHRAYFAEGALAGQDQAIGEILDAIDGALGRQGAAGFAEACKGRHVLEHRAVKADLILVIAFQAHGTRGPTVRRTLLSLPTV